MRIARALTFLFPAALAAVGIGFLIWSLSQAGAVDAYNRAPRCGDAVTPGCYEVLQGTIRSVHVSQSRSGERDYVVIETAPAGTLSVTLRPSASAAPHVRTGANVLVKRYHGQVTLVGVDGFGIASTADPVSSQTDASFAGWSFIGIALVAVAISAYPAWRGRRRRRRGSGEVGAAGAAPVTEILPSGNVGWSVRPRLDFSSVARYGSGAVLVPLLTIRALADPTRSAWALTFDVAIVVVVVGSIWLFFRNSRVFADKEKVGKTNLLGRTKILSVRDVKRAERFSVVNRYGSVNHLIFVGPDGRKAFEVAGAGWDFDRLDALCREAGIPLGGAYYEMVGAFGLNRRVPGTTKWGQQLLIGLALLVLVVPLIILIDGPQQR
jgi:hypothetical protein